VAAPVAATPTPAAPAPLPPPVVAPAPPPVAAAPVPSPAPSRAPLTAPAPPPATADLAPGHFAVQIAAFMTPASAEAQRSRLATQMQAASMPESEATRIVKRDDRYFVLVGDYADRAQAEALAAQLRTTLRRDVVIFRR
jgi:cell division protein FtsN